MVDLDGYYGSPTSHAAIVIDTTQDASTTTIHESASIPCDAANVYLRFSPETVGNILTITINGIAMSNAGSFITPPSFGGPAINLGPLYATTSSFAPSASFNGSCNGLQVTSSGGFYSCGFGRLQLNTFFGNCTLPCVYPPTGPFYQVGPLPTGIWNCPGASPTHGTSSPTNNPPNTPTTSQNTIVFGNSLPYPNPSYGQVCRQTNTYVIKRTQSAVVGDPQFVGLRVQLYQAHGIDGGVYSLISSPSLSMNSKFAYLNGPHLCPIIPSTGQKSVSCFQHAGSYLQNLAVLTIDGARVLIESGSSSQGLSAVQANGQDLQVGDFVHLHKNCWLSYNSTHEVTLQAGPFIIEIENSDFFLNLRQVTVPSSSWKELKADDVHGLLGQTWRMHRNKKTVIEGRVDDYLL